MGLMEIRREILSESASTDENLYTGGDKSFTRMVYVTLQKPLPPGKYRASAVVKSTDTNSAISNSWLLDSDNASLGKFSFSRSVGNERVSAVCTTTVTATKISFYASNTYANSAGDTASFTKIRIERAK